MVAKTTSFDKFLNLLSIISFSKILYKKRHRLTIRPCLKGCTIHNIGELKKYLNEVGTKVKDVRSVANDPFVL